MEKNRYQEIIDFLYNQTPQFQQIGAAAYKPGLHTVIALAQAFGNPHRKLKCIHVAGTNGKGSTAHSIAAVLQSAGYKTGLFTSPHLVDFRERIRINGQMISHEEVTEFVDSYRAAGLDCSPSFFELTTVMAFDWFAKNDVDFAVIEVGLGGRLDSTNIITPLLSVITNISFDHMAQLGNTLAAIASEKAGIIKPGIPVIIGEAENEVREVFLNKATECGSPAIFASETKPAGKVELSTGPEGTPVLTSQAFSGIRYELTGLCQTKNLQTITAAIIQLRRLGIVIPDDAVRRGLAHVNELTGLKGRWMKVSDNPLIICDTGHNIGGWQYISRQLSDYPGDLIMVIGFVNDKDITHILPLMPKRARYIFTRASVPRALPAETLASQAKELGLEGNTAPDVDSAMKNAREIASTLHEPMIFVGGSTFIVADLISSLSKTSAQ